MLKLVATLVVIFSATAQVNAAGLNPSCHKVWSCEVYGCIWRNVCARGCPDGISCYSLYGAYGPYGGVTYWGGYTSAGWGYRKW
jgi:hypothetical protein